MNNIILIGMPGSGKSSLGVVLAKKIGFGFIDSDLVIQEREGMTLERIIEKHGDAGFIQIENEVNCSISPHHTVIATGGSAVYGKEAMEHLTLNEQGKQIRETVEMLYDIIMNKDQYN